MIPDFDEKGDLPVAVHRATLPATILRFGAGSARRQAVADRLVRIHELARQTGHLARMIVFGSFVTNKAEPNDVDVAMIMDDEFVADPFSGDTRLLFDHAAAQAHFGASVFWVRQLASLAILKRSSKIGRSSATGLAAASLRLFRRRHDPER